MISRICLSYLYYSIFFIICFISFHYYYLSGNSSQAPYYNEVFYQFQYISLILLTSVAHAQCQNLLSIARKYLKSFAQLWRRQLIEMFVCMALFLLHFVAIPHLDGCSWTSGLQKHTPLQGGNRINVMGLFCLFGVDGSVGFTHELSVMCNWTKPVTAAHTTSKNLTVLKTKG